MAWAEASGNQSTTIRLGVELNKEYAALGKMDFREATQ
jgi:hypothetical protein